ncbi:MAG: hypothetical protein K2M76_06595, partial [Muribaculaceae bacterium]|nr:hypothetical protein [Muribaculaceae bacterium]
PYSVLQYISISWIFLLGYFSARKGWDIKSENLWVFLLCLSLLACMLMADQSFGLQASSINNQPLWFPLVFIAGILMINYLAAKITYTKVGFVLAFIGDFSFSVMALHFVGFKLLSYLRYLGDNRVDVTAFPVDRHDIYFWMPVYVIVGITFSMGISVIYSKVKHAWCSYCRIQES